MKSNLIVACLILLLFNRCKENDFDNELSGCNSNNLLEKFTTPDGDDVFIYEDGKAYINDNGLCTFILQYFDPNFLQDNYLTNASGTFLITDSGELFPTNNNFIEDFESYTSFTDLFIMSVSNTDLYWDSFTLQSPATPEIVDYNALRNCILDGTCTFIDNKIELITDPTNASNKVLKFTSVPPTANMITAKSSISSSINYYTKGSEVWYQADFYIESGMPFSLIDFENGYFHESPGSRVVIRGDKIEFENKFGAKLNIDNDSGITISQNQWFTLKIHLKYSNENDGIIELWQDGIPIISATGINLPTSNSVQNILEVGVSATSSGCVLLFDNMRISETSF
ncbi:MAG: polysaccharide lyase [Flavobacteriaceae bacterium]|nr:polysaccharide lyase [Flavobacteriaceae bacterium]